MSAELSSLLSQSHFGNTLQAYCASALAFGISFAAFLILRALGVGRLRKLAEQSGVAFTRLLAEVFGTAGIFELALVAIFIGTRSLILPPAFERMLRIVLVVVLSWRAVTMIQGVVSYAIGKTTEKVGLEDVHASSAARNMKFLINGFLWITAGLFVLDNLGVDITAAVAGLGIGGIAVALASQHILGDLFSSFVIYIDKPFKVGDFIVVGDLMGVVENIGVKTTRLRSIGGEMLVFSNSDLTGSRIRNYKHMRERRIAFGFGVEYRTLPARVREIPRIVGDIMSGIDKVRADRVHFKRFGPSSLDFEAVYHVLSSDYALYMDIQQKINLAMMDSFRQKGIGFAFPTQTVYLENVAQAVPQKAQGSPT